MHSVCVIAMLFTVLSPLVAVCQMEMDCALPDATVLEGVYNNYTDPIAEGSGVSSFSVTDFHYVCLAHSQQRGRYRFASVVVEYAYTQCIINGTDPECEMVVRVEQLEIGCSEGGNWISPVVMNDTNPKANFSTPPRDDCAFCASPESLSSAGVSFNADNITHCIACNQNCDEGLRQCYAFNDTTCCNYYNDSTCVAACPSPFLPNTEYDCDCPVGTTGHNCSDAIDCGQPENPENGNVSVSTTTYNSVATYFCNTGYTLTGDMSRTCLNTGLWSRSEPTCTECSVEDCERCDADIETCDVCSGNRTYNEQSKECVLDQDDGDDKASSSTVPVAAIVVPVVIVVIAAASIAAVVSAVVVWKYVLSKGSKIIPST